LPIESQSDRVEVVLVSPRNPLNIGAVARAMANFGFARLSVVEPYEPHWREAQSAVGAESLLENASKTASLADAVSGCTLVAGTGTLTYRKPDQPVVALPELAPILRRELERGGRVALVFGPEKHGLTREDLSHCHLLVEIPTDPHQPSMNLGQAAAVCLYEVAVRALSPRGFSSPGEAIQEQSLEGIDDPEESAAKSDQLDRLEEAIDATMHATGYPAASMQAGRRRDLRVLLRRLALLERETRHILGLFHRILRKLGHSEASSHNGDHTE
jgi:tRNA/rRNA methyltransferase